MSKRKHLLAVVGTVILLLSLAVPIMQCAPAAEEEVTPPAEEEVTPPAEEEVTPPAEEIKYGGRLVVGFTTPESSLTMDNKLLWTNWGCLYLMLVYDNLARYNRLDTSMDTYSYWPGLAKSYEVSEDGTTWTLHLVEGATWHDGVPVTAEDVAFTFEYLYQTPGWGGHTKVWDEIEVIDDYTIKVVHDIELSTVTPPGWWMWDPIIPKHIFEPYKDDILSFPNEESIGSGAFKLKEFEPDQYMWMEVNEDYWGERPYVDEVVFKNYGNMETALMAFEKGEVDTFGSCMLSAFNVEDLQDDPDINVEMVPGLGVTYLAFNLHPDGPLQDKNVRHAIAYGIDRDRLIDMAWRGYADRVDAWIYPESSMHKPDLPQYDYDPDKANEILDGAGYLDTDGDGIRNDPTTGENLVFGLATSAAYVVDVKVCTLIDEMLPAIGIQTNFQAMDADTFLDFLYNPMSDELDLMVYGEDPSPDPWSDWVWQEQVGWGSGGDWWNYSYYDNPRFNQLWVDNSAAKTVEEKKAILYELQDILAEDMPLFYLARSQCISTYRVDKFEGWVNEIGGPVSWLNDWSIRKVHLK